MKRATGAKNKKLLRMKEHAQSMGWPSKKESWLRGPIPYNICNHGYITYIYIYIFVVYHHADRLRFVKKLVRDKEMINKYR